MAVLIEVKFLEEAFLLVLAWALALGFSGLRVVRSLGHRRSGGVVLVQLFLFGTAGRFGQSGFLKKFWLHSIGGRDSMGSALFGFSIGMAGPVGSSISSLRDAQGRLPKIFSASSAKMTSRSTSRLASW